MKIDLPNSSNAPLLAGRILPVADGETVGEVTFDLVFAELETDEKSINSDLMTADVSAGQAPDEDSREGRPENPPESQESTTVGAIVGPPKAETHFQTSGVFANNISAQNVATLELPSDANRSKILVKGGGGHTNSKAIFDPRELIVTPPDEAPQKSPEPRVNQELPASTAPNLVDGKKGMAQTDGNASAERVQARFNLQPTPENAVNVSAEHVVAPKASEAQIPSPKAEPNVANSGLSQPLATLFPNMENGKLPTPDGTMAVLSSPAPPPTSPTPIAAQAIQNLLALMPDSGKNVQNKSDAKLANDQPSNRDPSASVPAETKAIVRQVSAVETLSKMNGNSGTAAQFHRDEQHALVGRIHSPEQSKFSPRFEREQAVLPEASVSSGAAVQNGQDRVGNTLSLTQDRAPELSDKFTPLISENVGGMPSSKFSVLPEITAQSAPPDLPRAVAQQLAAAMPNRPNQPVEIVLNPEELGRVRMTLSGTESQILVSIQAERGDTSDLMRRHLDILTEELRGLGYSDISFSFGGQQGQQKGQDAPPDFTPPTDPSEPDPQTPPIHHIPASGIDIRI